MEKVKERTGIYHEHQQGQLCAQHALNNLLQKHEFSVEALADIAQQLDIEESSVLTQVPDEFENMDDTGYFNIQVLQRALQTFEIELVPYASQEPIAKQARNNPDSMQAYICNLGAHWFTIRRFGGQFFDLNSCYYTPELIPPRVLTAYFKLIEDNGYSVFIVHGHLEDCLADQQLTINPIGEGEYKLLTKDLPKLIMDGKIMDPKDLQNHGRTVIKLPRDLYEIYRKNPNDPRVMQFLRAELPEYMIDSIVPEHAGGTNPHKKQGGPSLVVAVMSRSKPGEQPMPRCNCPNHRHQSPLMMGHLAQQLIDESFADMPNESYQDAQVLTQQTEYIVETPDPNNPNETLKQRRVRTQQVIFMGGSPFGSNGMDGSPFENNLMGDNYGTPRMTQGNTGFDNTGNASMRGIMGGPAPRNNPSADNDHIQQVAKRIARLEDEEDRLLQEIMAASLLSASGMDSDMHSPSSEDPREKIYQQILNQVLAESLNTHNAATKQTPEPSEIIPLPTTNSSSAPNTNSESVVTKTSPLPPTNTHSSVPQNTNSQPPTTNTYSSAPKTTDSPPPTTKYTPPLTNTNSSPPKTTDSLPPTTTNSRPPIRTNSTPSTASDSNVEYSPTVEELRLRRLQTYGNRDRSIISQQPIMND